MEKKFLVDKDMLFYAFRYSLGRMTFAPTTVIENLKANIKEISTDDIKAYIREIKEHEIYGYGMDCDRQDWMGFVKYLEAEIEKRSA